MHLAVYKDLWVILLILCPEQPQMASLPAEGGTDWFTVEITGPTGSVFLPLI